MEVIILGNPYDVSQGSITPITVPAYESEQAVVQLSDGYNPYIIGGSGSSDSNWYRYITGILRPLTITDKVVIGGSSFVDTEIFRVEGKVNLGSLQLGVSSTVVSSILDELDLISDSPTALPTQRSVKSYVDNVVLSTGIHVGDNISLLTNDVGYINSETDPIFSASPASSILLGDITNWNTAYTWGNHAIVGYLTAETDPIFSTSVAASILSSDITNWNTAYTDAHTHSNLGVLNSIISSGDGTQALFNDGTYKTVLATIPGIDTEVLYNSSGVLGANSAFTFNSTSGTVTGNNLFATTNLYLSDLSTLIYKDGSNNLTFSDIANPSGVSLSTLVAGSVSSWTVTTGGIYYPNKVGIGTSTLTEQLTILGNIQATDFNSSYLRYKNSNLLLGPNAGDNETGSNILYIANTNTSTPLVYGDFLNQSITFNADTYINSVKRLCIGDSTVSIRRDSSNNLVFQDPNANGGVAVTLTNLTTLTGYALKSDFISYSSVTTITAANLVTWGKASVITTTGAGTNFLADDGTYKAVGGGGVTPTDNILKWDSISSYYRIYTDKTEAGGVSSGGKLYGGTDGPTNTNRLNYDGYFYTYAVVAVHNITGQGYSGGTGTTGLTDFGTGILGTASTTGIGVMGRSTSGISGLFNNIIGNTSAILKVQYNSIDQFVVDTTGVNLASGLTYKINGTSIIPVADILDYQTNKYTPYSTQQSFLSFDTSSTNPSLTTRLNLNGYLYSFSHRAYNTELGGYSGYFYSSNTGSTGILGYGYFIGVRGSSTTGYAGYFEQNGSLVTSEPLLYLSRNVSVGSSNLSTDIISILDNPTTSGTISGSVLKATIGSIVRIDMNPRVADGVGVVAYIFDTHNLLSTSGVKLLSIKNQGTEKVYIDKDGVIEITPAGQGIILASPDGTRYKLTVANGGTLTITAV